MKLNSIHILIGALILSTSCGTGSDKQKNSEQKTNQSSASTGHKDEYYIQKGDSIAQTAFKALSGELKAAMKRGGVEEALSYCNVNAYPLTDSVGAEFNVKLKRVAEKYRNPANQLSEADRPVFDEMSTSRSSKLVHRNKTAVYYKAIMLKGQCLPCHGTVGKEISKENYARIKKHYPDDRATGFQPNDLRGMWKITFDKSE